MVIGNIMNQRIASQLEALATSIEAKEIPERNDIYRVKSYRTAADAIRKYPKEITSGRQAKDEIKGVGKTTAERIDEFITSGSVTLKSRDEDSDILVSDIEQTRAIELFKGIYGVGDVTAKKWYDDGYRTLEQLTSLYPGMTAAQKLGYIYYHQLALRIPRSEINIYQQVFEKLIPDREFMICGSYRRGHRTSGDIDLLIKTADKSYLATIVDRLTKVGIIIGTLSFRPGGTKFLGISRLNEHYNARRLDMMVISPERWGAAALYFTGSKELNVHMREVAIAKGYRLNEYGLWRVPESGSVDMKDMTLLEAETERQIFELLEIDYLEPEDRDI